MQKHVLKLIPLMMVHIAGCGYPVNSHSEDSVGTLDGYSHNGALGSVTERLDEQYGPTDTRDGELRVSDRELNKTYQSLINRLDAEDQALLRSAQRAWIKFRDADCKVAYVDVRDCLIARTQERDEQLRESLFFDEDGQLIDLNETGD